MNPPSLPQSTAPQHSGLSTASMVCGFLAVPSCWATTLPAIIMGHIAWSEASKAGKPPGRAKLGLIFGYGSLVLIPVIAALAGLLAPLVIKQRTNADMAQYTNNMRLIGMALTEHHANYGEFPENLGSLESVENVGAIDELLHVRKTYPGEWLYNPKASQQDGSAILLVSPEIDRRKLTLLVDGSVRMEPSRVDKFLLEIADFTAVPVPREEKH